MAEREEREKRVGKSGQPRPIFLGSQPHRGKVVESVSWVCCSHCTCTSYILAGSNVILLQRSNTNPKENHSIDTTMQPLVGMVWHVVLGIYIYIEEDKRSFH